MADRDPDPQATGSRAATADEFAEARTAFEMYRARCIVEANRLMAEASHVERMLEWERDRDR